MDAVIVVLNNGGGSIFGYLPQAGLEQFEEHWLTPTNLDFRTVAELYSLNFHRVSNQAEFKPALARAIQEPGPSMLEVIINREQSLARHLKWLERVTDPKGAESNCF